MHCWKSINVQKQYGFYRIFLFSVILVLTVFSFLHVSSAILRPSTFNDQYFLLFVLGFLLIYPLHKAFHVLPLLAHLQHIRIKSRFHFVIVPILSVRITKAIPKYAFVSALVTPFIVINSALLAGAFLFPASAHYFTMLTAYHCGICLVDFLYAKCLFRSPRESLIEESDDGYEILIPQKGTGFNGATF